MKSLKFGFLFRTLSLLLLAGMVFVSCSKDDDDDKGGGGGGPSLVEDGVYIKGGGTAYADFSTKALFSVAKNEVNQQPREQLMEVYMAVKAGSEGFNIVVVDGGEQTSYGPGSDWAEVLDLNVDEPQAGLWKGSLAETNNSFTVSSDGLYHVIIDFELNKVALAKVEWGIIGGATPEGWGTSTPMTQSAFNLTKMTYKVENLLLLENEYKFRYSNGWKIILDEVYDLGEGVTGINANTNFGGSINALDAGGENIKNSVYGVYTVELIWEAGAGYKGSLTKTGDGPDLPDYPENMYIIGSAIGGWDWDAGDGKQLIPVHSHPELFWGIFSMEAGQEFKFAPVEKWQGDFGRSGDADDGVFAIGGDNVPVPGESGYYMVVINLDSETIEVKEPNVYMIGDAVDSWDAAQPENRFSVNSDFVTFTGALVSDTELRMHVGANTLNCEWWQAEFIILDGNIEYRGTGDDQERVKIGAGQTTIKLNFKDNTGIIE